MFLAKQYPRFSCKGIVIEREQLIWNNIESPGKWKFLRVIPFTFSIYRFTGMGMKSTALEPYKNVSYLRTHRVGVCLFVICLMFALLFGYSKIAQDEPVPADTKLTRIVDKYYSSVNQNKRHYPQVGEI